MNLNCSQKSWLLHGKLLKKTTHYSILSRQAAAIFNWQNLVWDGKLEHKYSINFLKLQTSLSLLELCLIHVPWHLLQRPNLQISLCVKAKRTCQTMRVSWNLSISRLNCFVSSSINSSPEQRSAWKYIGWSHVEFGWTTKLKQGQVCNMQSYWWIGFLHQKVG